MKKMIALALCLMSVFACCGCESRSLSDMVTVAGPEVTQTPQAAPEAEPGDAAVPSPGVAAEDNGADDEYLPSELDGVASAEDILLMYESYEDARAVNEDVIGWITVDNTRIDYPVLRCENNDYYLGRNLERKKSKYGVIFMDYRNADPSQQRHIIIYGHNMRNGTMFHDLGEFKQKDFFDANRYIKFMWDGTETEWEIFAAYIIAPNTIYHIHTVFGSDEDFAKLMNETIEYAGSVKPSNISDITILPSDQVMTLSTCTYEYDDSYFAVMARRIK